MFLLDFQGFDWKFQNAQKGAYPRLATSHERRWTFVRVPGSEETITYFTASYAMAFIVIYSYMSSPHYFMNNRSHMIDSTKPLACLSRFPRARVRVRVDSLLVACFSGRMVRRGVSAW
jgi:hypothetical protein